MSKKYFCIPAILLSLLIYSCEDEVVLDLPDAPPVLVVDAFVNNISGEQNIILTWTQPYFSSTLPDPATGAQVILSNDNGNQFEFSESVTPGKYTWMPVGAETIGSVGDSFELEIVLDGVTFQATSEMNRVPVVDSVYFTYMEEATPFQDQGYYGEFAARDIVGSGDFYWIKAYKNDTLLLRPFELNYAADAGFTPGGNIDGVVFIQPIQDGVNPLNDDLSEIIPYVPGDSLYVEIHSITEDTWYFLNQVAIQTQRDGGFDEIFAEPLDNVPSNIVATGSSDQKAVGFFSVSAVQGNGRRLTE